MVRTRVFLGRFINFMLLHVKLEDCVGCEGLRALFALERLFPLMDPLVDLQGV